MGEIAVLLMVRADDARLVNYGSATSPPDMYDVRQAVIDVLPAAVTRVVAIMDESHARAIMQAVAAVDTVMGRPPVYAHRDYKSPVRH